MPKIVFVPDQHRCYVVLASLGKLPVGSVVECDCGVRYVRRDGQRDGPYWARADETGGGGA